MSPITKYEVILLLETPTELVRRTAFLGVHDHQAFSKLADVIAAKGRDPQDVTLVWSRTDNGRRTSVRFG